MPDNPTGYGCSLDPDRTDNDVRATPDWTPVAIPGRPGWSRHWVDGEQVDRPDTPTT